MDRLPYEPTTLREIVEADLRRAARAVIRVQDEIDWQVRIATRQGDYMIIVTMPGDDRERALMLRRLATFLHDGSDAGIAAAVIPRRRRVHCL